MNEEKVLTTQSNQVTIVGEIVSDFKFSHEVFGEKFYEFNLSVKRFSGITDIIPCLVSERTICIFKNTTLSHVKINGRFRSYNKVIDDKSTLVLAVLVKDIELVDESSINPVNKENNMIILDSIIVKPPILRKTPLGRKIADVLVAVHRPYGNKSDYIPCICWSEIAQYVSTLSVGDKLKITGRIQSRQYVKTSPTGEMIDKTAYEVSVYSIDLDTHDEN